jgi:hypothetical protein
VAAPEDARRQIADLVDRFARNLGFYTCAQWASGTSQQLALHQRELEFSGADRVRVKHWTIEAWPGR